MNAQNEVSKDHVEIVPEGTGPTFSADELAAIETIANGGSVEGFDVSTLDHAIMVGLHTALKSADKAFADIAGHLGAALSLRTWQRVSKADNTPYESEWDFIECQVNAHPVVAQVLKGTEVRRAVVAVITNATDADGKRITDRRMAELLGANRSVVNLDRQAAEGRDGSAERGPQDGGQVEPDSKAVKRYVTNLTSNAAKVREAESGMTAEQLLAVIEQGKDLVTTALATLRKRYPDTDVPEWAVAFAASFPTGPGRLRSGAEGTVGTGPAPATEGLAGAPADPTGISAPAPAPKPGPRGRKAAAAS